MNPTYIAIKNPCSEIFAGDLTVNAQQNDQIDYHWQHIATPTKTTNYILDKSPLCPTRALIHTLTITVSGNTLDKIHFDKLTSSLFELTELQKVTFIVQSLTFETEIDKTVKILEKQFQAARDAPNFKLTIIIQGRELFWPQPRSSPQWRIPLPTTPNLGSSISVRSEDPKMQSDADQKMARNLELKHYRALIADLLNRINRMQLHSKARRLASS